jgi:hypothetical protein
MAMHQSSDSKLPAGIVKKLEQTDSGEFGGNGVYTFTFDSKPLGISLSTLAASNESKPAIIVKKIQRAGAPIQVGDQLLRVGESNVKGWGLKNVMGALKAANFPITMEFRRAGGGGNIDKRDR